MYVKRYKILIMCLIILFSLGCVLIKITPESKVNEVTQIVPITQIVQSTEIITIPKTVIVEVLVEVTTTPSPAQPPMENLIAYYPLNGNANDESGNQFDATVNGATLTCQGKKGCAYEFDGIDDYIEVVNIPYKQTGAISVWALFFENKRDSCIWSLGDENSDLMILGIRSYNTGTDNISFGALYGRQYYINAEDLPKSQNWHHFVGVWDETSIYFYVDGIPQGTSVNTSTTLIENYDRFNITRFGIFNYEDTGKHRGMIDEILIYDKPLSPDDVLKLYVSYLD